ncbi:MAG: hypothetical protein ACI4F3_13505 [Enterocloster sp.]
MERIIEKQLSFSRLELKITAVGEDCHLLFSGGDRPHIGCCVLAVPRPSLTGNGSISCTSSVINVTGHKDEEICRFLAERAAMACGAVTVCTGGFHVDSISAEQLKEVMEAVKEMETRMHSMIREEFR